MTATRLATLQFEAAKSVIATALWLWLFIDSAAQDRNWKQRLPRAAIASILLLWVELKFYWRHFDEVRVCRWWFWPDSFIRFWDMRFINFGRMAVKRKRILGLRGEESGNERHCCRNRCVPSLAHNVMERIVWQTWNWELKGDIGYYPIYKLANYIWNPIPYSHRIWALCGCTSISDSRSLVSRVTSLRRNCYGIGVGHFYCSNGQNILSLNKFTHLTFIYPPQQHAIHNLDHWPSEYLRRGAVY